MYQLHYATITHPGKIRVKNEDNFYVDGKWKKDIGKNDMLVSGIVRSGKLFTAVFDGMGGRAKGERASFIAAESMEKYDLAVKNGQAPHLNDDEMYYVQRVNRVLCNESDRTGRGMGTTMAVLEFVDDSVVSENIGDSRIYRWSSGRLEQISTDHTMVARMIRMKQITEEEAREHHMNHRLTQYLGIPEEEMILEPETTGPIRLKQGDRFLICSDGLTDMLTNKEISEIMQCKLSVDNLANRLVQEALAAGGKDNITVSVIEVAGAESQKRGSREAIEKSRGNRLKSIVLIIVVLILIMAGVKYKNGKGPLGAEVESKAFNVNRIIELIESNEE